MNDTTVERRFKTGDIVRYVERHPFALDGSCNGPVVVTGVNALPNSGYIVMDVHGRAFYAMGNEVILIEPPT